jgi:hypothetical protein
MKTVFLILFTATCLAGYAQDSTTNLAAEGTVIINKDPRLDVLAENEANFNANALKSGKGYRLMVLNTNNRNLAMSLRSKLLQRYPDQKVYMSFQPPYIKLKFGDFVEKADADNFKDELVNSKLVSGNIYVVPEIIALKPDTPAGK